MEKTYDLKTMTILFRCVQAIEQIVKKDIMNYGLTLNEFSALEVIYHKGKMPVQGICQKVLIPNSSMTYVLDKLEEKQLIVRKQDAIDKRAIYVELTPLGLSKSKEVFPKHYDVMEQVFAVLTKDEKETINRLLKKLGFYAVDLSDNE